MAASGVITPQDLAAVTELIVQRFREEQKKRGPPHRILVGLAGRPGSGKTTALHIIADAVESRLASGSPSTSSRRCVCMPMDGYHLYRRELAAMKDPKEAFRRRGAEWTFNPENLARDLQQLKSIDHTKSPPTYTATYVPSFNHGTGDPVEKDILIPAEAQVVLVEGNYLLYSGTPEWAKVVSQFDVKLFLYCSRDLCTERLCRRHMKAWKTTREAAMTRAKGSDTTNGDLVDTTRTLADKVISSVEVTSSQL